MKNQNRHGRAELFGKLVPVMQKAFPETRPWRWPYRREIGGTITITDNVMTLEDFTQDGRFVLNGELTFDGAVQPPSLKGDLVTSGKAPVDIVLDMTVDLAADPPYGGTVTVARVEYLVMELMAELRSKDPS